MTVEALRGRRPEVLGDLLRRYGREIQGVAYLILREREGAEDVVVDTLLTALEHGDRLRDPEALRPWLMQIATNRALAVRRREQRVVRLRVVPESADRDPDHAGRLVLLSVVEGLPTRMRAAVVLRYYADLPVRDVARALGTSENTVKSQLREALARMRVSLADAPQVPEASYG